MKKPIRILHVLQRMEAGGTQALLMNIYRNIDREKVQFDFFVEYEEKQFYDDEILDMGGKIYYSNVRKDFNIFKFEKKLKEVIIENDYKIVHVHTYSIGYFALKTAKKCGVPVRIAHSHNNETVHDSKYYIKKVLQKLYTIYATDFFACSISAGKYLFKNRNFQVLNNSIDSGKFIFDSKKRESTRKELGIDDCLVVGNVGRLHPQKNQTFLLDIFNNIKNVNEKSKLIIIGSGPLEKELKEKVHKLNLDDDVIFLSNRKDMPELFQSMDIFILPSLFEGLGIVAIEAQAAGIPCLTSDMVPKETLITPLIKQKSLDDSPEIWAKEAIENAKNKFSKTNTQKDIIKNGYDIKDSAKKIEEFYFKKYVEK